ncbi:glycerol-3-phosphate 1-O-acyltransferase PlsY [Rickettsiales bacterium LUAb2]
MTTLIILIILSYLIGSIPFGFVLVYLVKGIDIRTIGSGNIGTTNVLRSGFPLLAILTLILDISKGFILAFIGIHFLHQDYGFLIGLAAVIGHLYPVFLKFKGGKGVATALGLILAIDFDLFLLCIATWLLVAIIFKYSSLAAITTFVVLPIYGYLFNVNHIILCSLIILAIVVIIKHKSNIKNLLNKTETKIKLKKDR